MSILAVLQVAQAYNGPHNVMTALYNHASMQIKSNSQHRGGGGLPTVLMRPTSHPSIKIRGGGGSLGGRGGRLEAVGLGLGNMLAVDTFCKGNHPLEHLPKRNAEKRRIPNSRGHTEAWESVSPTQGATPKRGSPYL